MVRTFETATIDETESLLAHRFIIFFSNSLQFYMFYMYAIDLFRQADNFAIY